MKNLSPKPWVKTTAKFLVVVFALVVCVLISLILHYQNLRLDALEHKPAVVIEKVEKVTMTPTPSVKPVITKVKVASPAAK